MYSYNQTLRNIKNDKLYALHPESKGSFWNWEIGKETRFIDELGNIFYDDIKNYTHISDHFDRADFTPKGIRKNKYIDERLYNYIDISEEEKENKILEDIKEIIRKLEENSFDNYITFSDGSKNYKLQERFKSFVDAKREIVSDYKFSACNNMYFFSMFGRKYLIHDGCIARIVSCTN